MNIEEKDGKRTVKWEPNFRFIDTASVTPDPETQIKFERIECGNHCHNRSPVWAQTAIRICEPVACTLPPREDIAGVG
ncbi:MAG TPA: hypothetical protein VJ019_10680 [Aestuariivirga sp.]|nr:hypothetical protein [Aestuariivirga sp.]